MHRYQHGAAGRTGCNRNDRPVAQGDGHVALGRVFQGGGIGDAGTAFGNSALGRQMQRGVSGCQTLLRSGGLRASAVAVMVGQGVHALTDAQQLHKGAAAVSATTGAQAARCGIQRLVQVGPALKGLDDGVGCGRCGDSTVLRGGALIGFDHVVIQTHVLRWRHGQQAAVFHQEFGPDIAHGADGFAFLQFIADLQGATDACGVDCVNGAVAIDGGEGCELGHENLR